MAVVMFKDFLDEWRTKNLKEMSKEDRMLLLYDSIPDIINFYIRKAHQKKEEDNVNKLFSRMGDKMFVKALTNILKDKDMPVESGLAIVINEFLTKNVDSLDEDTFETYTKIIDKLLKKRVKKITKKMPDIDQDLLKELLVIYPEPEMADIRFIGIYVRKMLAKLYRFTELEKEMDSDTFGKLFNLIFGKETDVAVALEILLERRDRIKGLNAKQVAIWNALTNYALNTLENLKKKEIKDHLKFFVDRRKKDAERGYDAARRVSFDTINADDYPKIIKIVKAMKEDSEINNKFL